MPGERFMRPVNAVAVELVWPDIRQKPVPYHVGLFRQRDASGFLHGVARIEQTQFDLARVLRKQGEIDADSCPGGAEGIRISWPDSHARRGSSGVPTVDCHLLPS